MPIGGNLPFVHYGDLGCNAWGCRGFSTEGFVAETYVNSQCFTDVQRVASNPISGRPALAITANCVGQHPNLANGEVYTEALISLPVACPKVEANALMSLEGVTARLRLCFPPGSAGPDSARNGFQFLFKSRIRNEFPSLYSDWMNIDPAWEGRCVDLSFGVSTSGPGQRFGSFDATRVALVGFKIGTNSASPTARIQGQFYLERFVLEANPPIIYDFEVPLLEKNFRAIRDLALGMGAPRSIVRVFLLVDGRSGIVWAADGSVQRLDDRVFRDFDALVSSAGQAQVLLVPVLLDFTWFSRARQESGVQLGGRSYVIRGPAVRQTLLDRAIEPLLQRYGNHSSILAWECINEPEWVSTGITGFQPNLQEHDPVALSEMREFVRLCADSVRRFTRHGVTVGSARRSWVQLWKDLGLTLHSFHYYDSDPEPFPWRASRDLQLDQPVMVTEVPTAKSRIKTGDYLRAARQGGYDGLCFWSCRGRDEATDFPAAAADLLARVPQMTAAGLSNAASFLGGRPLAPDAWFALFGRNLAPALAQASGTPLPASLDGTTVTLTDSMGTQRPAHLLFVAPGQVNFLVPAESRSGSATLTVSRLDGGSATVEIQIVPVSPGLFAANADGRGAAAALVTRVRGESVISTELAFRCDATGGNCQAAPFDFGPEGEEAILILFGTGIRNRPGLTAVSVRVGGRELTPLFAGAQGAFEGLDQVNVP
ncbi:MAG: hypothetical protein AAB225_23755, partial [Acidobacteriota bacterium]